MRQVAEVGVFVSAGGAEPPPSAAWTVAGMICMAVSLLATVMSTASSSPGAPPRAGFQDDLQEALVRHLGCLQCHAMARGRLCTQ